MVIETWNCLKTILGEVHIVSRFENFAEKKVGTRKKINYKVKFKITCKQKSYEKMIVGK